MIFCNQCGSALADGLIFCPDCGAEIPAFAASKPTSALPTDVLPGNAAAVPTQVLGPEVMPTLPLASPLPAQPLVPGPSVIIPKSNAPKLILGFIGGFIILALMVTIYVVSSSNKTSKNEPSSATTSAPDAADSLQEAIDSGKLVTLSTDDAYSYYYRLKSLSPQHRKLTEVKSKVLAQLRSMGEEVMRRAASIQWRLLTSSDWNMTQRVYQWASDLEPNDRSLEARLRYAEAEIARHREDRYNAERGYQTAMQLDSSWALPQYSMGLMRMRKDRSASTDNAAARGREAAPYFRRAIELEQDWELPYMSMGTANFLQKDYDAAESWYRKAMEMNSQWGGPHAWMGAVYEKRNQCSAAISEYNKAIELDPNGYELDVIETQRKIDQISARCSG